MDTATSRSLGRSKSSAERRRPELGITAEPADSPGQGPDAPGGIPPGASGCTAIWSQPTHPLTLLSTTGPGGGMADALA